MKIKDLPKYCESHYCYCKSRYGFLNRDNQPECEYQNMCRVHFFSTMPKYLCYFLDNLETDIRKDESDEMV